MSLINSSAERLRRANALWHAYLTTTGQRFDLATFLNDSELEKQVIAGSLAHGDPKLALLAQDWLRDTGQAVAVSAASRGSQSAAQPAANASAEGATKPSRYLRGVR
jgi:hypothetical protein